MSKNTAKLFQEEVCEENFEKTCQITFKQEATRETIRKCYRYRVLLVGSFYLALSESLRLFLSLYLSVSLSLYASVFLLYAALSLLRRVR